MTFSCGRFEHMRAVDGKLIPLFQWPYTRGVARADFLLGAVGAVFSPDFDEIWHVSSLAPWETIESDFLRIEPQRAEIVGGG